MNALRTQLRTSNRLPSQVGRRWASTEPSARGPVSAQSAEKPEFKRRPFHKTWNSVKKPRSFDRKAGLDRKAAWKAAGADGSAAARLATSMPSPTRTRAPPPPPTIIIQTPQMTSVNKLKRMLDPSAPFFRGSLPLTPPTLPTSRESLSRLKRVETLRSPGMTNYLKVKPDARWQLEGLSPSQLASHVLSRNPTVNGGGIKTSVQTISQLAEKKTVAPST
ncbi:hypothetical protein FRB90_002445 [Tulasnella sp. 427]|nr:hypothetical protein FRB90_002445 [Tulasnella sp. 427]